MTFLVHFKIKCADKYMHKKELLDVESWPMALQTIQNKYLGSKIFIKKITQPDEKRKS